VLANLLSLCDAHTLFVDIGANVGIYSLLVASQTGAQVLAFEPVRSTFQALVRNCSLNPALPITQLNLAIGAAPEVVQMTALPGSCINHVTPVAKQSRELHQQAFQLCLDQLQLPELANGFGKIVIKIDVERHEFEVLTGAQNLLSSSIPMALCIEIDPVDSLRLERCLPDHFRPFQPPYNQCFPVAHEPNQTDFLYVNELWDSV